MSTVSNLAAARTYWATLARDNPLNASSLVYGLINDLEDARAEADDNSDSALAAWNRAEAAEACIAAALRIPGKYLMVTDDPYSLGFNDALEYVRRALTGRTS
jgi:hypothetical protein